MIEDRGQPIRRPNRRTSSRSFNFFVCTRNTLNPTQDPQLIEKTPPVYIHRQAVMILVNDRPIWLWRSWKTEI